MSGAAPRRGRRRTPPRIPLVPLGTFHAVAVLGSFSAAARHLGITQPAVTQQVRRLERDLGLPLFDRAGRRAALTHAGQTLETYAQRLVRLLDAAHEALESLAGVRTGHLRVGASRTAGSYYIAGLLDRFKLRYPGVRVSLSVGNSETVLARVLDLSLDAGLIAGPCEDPRVVSIPFVRDRLLVIAAPGHPLSGAPAIGIEDLAGYAWISREPGSRTRRLIERALAAHGLEIHPTMELESNEAIKSAVADGIGIGIMAQAAVARDLAAGRLAGRPLREPLGLEFALVYHRDRALSPALGAFLELLPSPRMRAGVPRPPARGRAVTPGGQAGFSGSGEATP